MQHLAHFVDSFTVLFLAGSLMTTIGLGYFHILRLDTMAAGVWINLQLDEKNGCPLQ